MITANIQTSSIYACAALQPGKTDEDRFAVLSDIGSIENSAFAVFDGHGGPFGSQLCSERYCADIITELNNKISDINDIEDVVYDAFFCQTVYDISYKLNREIKSSSRTGTTVSAVFIRKMKDESHQIYCVNIGDSRATLASKGMVVALSEDHSLKSPRELTRITNHELAEWIPMPIDIKLVEIKKFNKEDASIFPRRNYPDDDKFELAKFIVSGEYVKSKKKNDDDIKLLSISPKSSPRSPGSKSPLFSHAEATLSSETDTDATSADGTNIDKITSPTVDATDVNAYNNLKMSVTRSVLSHDTELRPSMIINAPRKMSVFSLFKRFSAGSGNKEGGGGGEDGSYKPRELDSLSSEEYDGDADSDPGNETFEKLGDDEDDSASLDSSRYNRSLHSTGSSFHGGSGRNKKKRIKNILISMDEDEGFITSALVHEKSFIAKRKNAAGETSGPMALFSRHDVSITMTRSLGDRHAARTCVFTPEITKFVLPPSQYARVYVGSDGLWDVVTNEKSHKLAKGIKDPLDAAKKLVRYARTKREEACIKIDDITCIVVDINPSSRRDNSEPCQVS